MFHSDKTSCPSADLLLRFASGEIGEAMFCSIAEHLNLCDVCVADLSRLKIDVPIDGTCQEECFDTLPTIEVETLSRSIWEDETPEMIGKYSVKFRIAVGGMGVVYEAQHPSLLCDVVIKTIKPQRLLNADARDRMLEEQRLMGRIRHPSVVAVLDAGVDGDVPYLVMEKVDGMTLREQVRRAEMNWVGGSEPRNIDWRCACHIGQKIAIALQQLHEVGLVHRDVKPGNIMVTPGGEIKLLDLGLAVEMGPEDAPVTAKAAGTPAFWAPEQTGGQLVDFRTDLYGLGTTIVFMLAGSSRQEPTRTFCYSDLPERGIPKRLRVLIAELLASDPARRPSSAKEVAGRLQRIADRHRQPTWKQIAAALLVVLTLLSMAWRVWPAARSHSAQSKSIQQIESTAPSRIFRRKNLSYRGPQSDPVTFDIATEIPRSDVLNAKVSRNEKYLACFDIGGNLRIYDLRSPTPTLLQMVRCYETTNTDCPQINWMNQDSVVAVTGAGYAPLLFWDIADQSFCGTALTPHQVVGSDTDASSRRLAVIDTSGRLAIYDSDGALQHEVFATPQAVPSAVKWVPDSSTLLLAVEGGQLFRVFGTKRSTQGPIEVYQHTSTVTALELGQTGNCYLGDSKGSVLMMDSQFAPLKSFQLCDHPIRSIVETHETGELYASANEISRVDLVKGSVSHVGGVKETHRTVFIHRSGGRIVCAGGDVSSINLDQRDNIETWLRCSIRPVTEISFDDTAERIAVCFGDSLAVIDSDGQVLLLHRFEEGSVESISWSPNGCRLAAASGWGGENFYLFQAQDEPNSLQLTNRISKPKCVVGLAWLDERRLGIAGESGILHVWDTQSGQFEFRHRLGDFVRSFSVSPDKKRLAFGFQHNGILVLDRNLNTAYSDRESFGRAPVRMLRWHRDNARLAAMSLKKQVIIYDVDAEVRNIQIPSQWSQPTCIAWSGHESEIDIAPLGRFTVEADGSLSETRADRRDRIVAYSADGRRRVAADQLSTLHYYREGVLKWSLLLNQDGTAVTVDVTGNVTSRWGNPKELIR